MNNKVTIQTRSINKSGTNQYGKPWTLYNYQTNQGTFKMLDYLEEGKEYTIESYIYKSKDGKDQTGWRLPKSNASNQNAEKLDDILKLLKWLVKNNPNYIAPAKKPEGDPPF